MIGTRRNVAANIVGRIWSIASVYLFVPIYLRLLGPEAYGVVGAFAVVLAALVVADLGLTATMNREMARLGARNASADERRDLARTIELIYGGLATLIGIALIGAAPLVADHWLRPESIPRAQLVEALRLMGLAVALQLPAGLYSGGLFGLERQVAANGLQVAWGLLRSGGAALALWLVAPTLRVFFMAVTLANLLYLVGTRVTFWRALGPPAPSQFRIELLIRTWRYSVGMAGMTVLSMLLIQLDKVAVSRLVPLSQFAYYSLASALAQAPIIAAAAIASAVFPRLTAIAASGGDEELRKIYHSACQLVAVIAIPLGLTLAAFAPDVLAFWTRTPGTANTAGAAARLLLLGSTALALQIVPYQLALAFGWVGLNLRLAGVSLVLMAPALWWLVSRYGLAGAGWAWLILNAGTLAPMIVLVHRRLLPGATRAWAITDVAPPLLATMFVLAAAWGLFRIGTPAHPFLFAFVAGTVALVAAALVSPATRSWLRAGRSAPATP